MPRFLNDRANEANFSFLSLSFYTRNNYRNYVKIEYIYIYGSIWHIFLLALSYAIIPFAKKNSKSTQKRRKKKKRKKKEGKEKEAKTLKVTIFDLVRTKQAIINEVGVRLQGNTSGVRDSAVCWSWVLLRDVDKRRIPECESYAEHVSLWYDICIPINHAIVKKWCEYCREQ